MSPDQLKDDQLDDERLDDSQVGDATEDEAAEDESAESKKLELEVEVKSPSACERRVVVTIPREDIDRYFDEALGELTPKASVPGFRVGRAPRKLVEARYRKEMKDQVKGSLLMDSMEQISEEQEFTAISEPDFDLEAIEIPDEGPMTFEFDIEVRPEFDLPQWRGLKVVRSVREFTDEDIAQRINQILERFGKLVPHKGAAEDGDYLTLNITCRHGEEIVAEDSEVVVRSMPKLSFRDAQFDGFDKLMRGVKAGETRQAKVQLTHDAPNEALRGEQVEVEFEVLEVKKLELPELTAEFLEEMGDFESREDLEKTVRSELVRQLEYRQARQIRQQIIQSLTASADWELPPGMLKRQAARELERAILELRRNGFSEPEIRARENQLRQNSAKSTAEALKEHFILERIAEEEEIDADAGDYEMEIALIAAQSGQTARRVRAQLEKRELMDVIRNQIVERKVIGLVRDSANFKDEPYEMKVDDTEAVDFAAGGAEEEDIPEAQYAPESKPNPSTLAQSRQHD